MEFLKGFRIVLLAAFCMLVSVEADLNAEKEKAIKDLDAQMESVKKYSEKSLVDAEEATKMAEYISKFYWDFGHETKYDIDYKLNKTAETALIMAEVLKSPDTVTKCILNRQREMVEENYAYYTRSFCYVYSFTTRHVKESQEKDLSYWKYSNNVYIERYMGVYKKSKEEIRLAPDVKTISEIVKELRKYTNAYLGSEPSILRDLARIHIHYLRNAKIYPYYFKMEGTENRKTATEDFQKCFS